MKTSTPRHAGPYTPLAPRAGIGAPRHAAPEVSNVLDFPSFPLYGDDAKFAAKEDARLARIAS